ncbi:MAG: hypothetical protein WC819_01320 [Parcubacteria group bacterium]|jgi:hypothetical protein
MDKPRDWTDCAKISRRTILPPQIIADAYGISRVCDNNEEENLDRLTDVTTASLAFHKACYMGRMSLARKILEKIVQEFLNTRSDCEYVIEQTAFLGYADIMQAAIRKMMPMLIDD